MNTIQLDLIEKPKRNWLSEVANDKLFKIGLSDSDKCSFCGTYTEDLYHLFFNCSFVQAFWNVFIVWWFDLNFVFKGYYGWLTSEERFVKLFDNFREINYLGM